MKRNRKKVETCRFNGHPRFHAGSVRPMMMADLEARIKHFEAKLADPEDPDDKRWTCRWLARFRKELKKSTQISTVDR
jgi:hypothetical protein